MNLTNHSKHLKMLILTPFWISENQSPSAWWSWKKHSRDGCSL